MITNPRKTFQLAKPLEDVLKYINALPILHKKFKLTESNTLFNKYTFKMSEFVSFGAFADITIAKIDENNSNIEIEIRRAIGAFDKAHEVSYANNHITSIVDGLTDVAKNTIPELDSIIENEKVEAQNRIKNEQKKVEKEAEQKQQNPIKYYLDNYIWKIIFFGALFFGFYMMITKDSDNFYDNEALKKAKILTSQIQENKKLLRDGLITKKENSYKLDSLTNEIKLLSLDSNTKTLLKEFSDSLSKTNLE